MDIRYLSRERICMKQTDHKAGAYLSLGSNLGDRFTYLQKAICEIADRLGKVERVSRTYESPSWGYRSANNYYNACLLLRTSHGAEEVMKGLLEIEADMGRSRAGGGLADRVIDLDLLLYDRLVTDTPWLRIPHPRMEERRFVLEPLAEIAPELIHPVIGLTIVELLKQCPDKTALRPV
jgi:2-amino-4-hydroxy-6-hydroxymethyldihydropteridine diphosphokinase